MPRFTTTSEGKAIGEVALETYIGACRILHCIGTKPVVTPSHIEALLGDDLPPHILFCTYAQTPLDAWDADFCAVAPEIFDETS